MLFEEYASYDGFGLAELINKGEVSAEEVRQTALTAIESRNPKLNAVLTTLPVESEAEVRSGLPDGPFKGVPFLIKELVLQARGALCRAGSRGTPEEPCPADTELMCRFRQAGLLLVGTTQTPEFGYNATTEPVAFGPVHNPWKAGYSAGGSSGGSGAAVAAGLVPVAHANDGGGSIRIPASCNGLVGLKPTRDRTPTGPAMSDPLFSHAIEFIVSRSVRDSAVLLDQVAGPDTGGPHLIAPPSEPFAELAAAPFERRRIAVMTKSFFGVEPDDACAQAVARTGALLEDLGHEIVDDHELQLGWDEFVHYINMIWSSFLASNVAAVSAATGRPATPGRFEAVTLACAEYGRTLSALDILGALDYVNGISRQVGAFFESIDVLLTPTLATPPPEHGTLNQNQDDVTALEWAAQTFTYAPYTPVFNSTGQPAISLPVHWSEDGRPVGTQLVGHMGAEGTLLNLATQLESAADWRSRQQALMT